MVILSSIAYLIMYLAIIEGIKINIPTITYIKTINQCPLFLHFYKFCNNKLLLIAHKVNIKDIEFHKILY